MTLDAFGSNLRRIRLQRGISLTQIAESTKIAEDLLDGLERNDFSQWPTGIYARAWVRQYASAIGADAELTVDEFCRHFPRAIDAPNSSSANSRTSSAIVWRGATMTNMSGASPTSGPHASRGRPPGHRRCCRDCDDCCSRLDNAPPAARFHSANAGDLSYPSPATRVRADLRLQVRHGTSDRA